MSSPIFGFSSLRRGRPSSIRSQDTQEDTPASNPPFSPFTPPPSAQSTSNDGKLLSSSLGSTSHRGPIRSFIHGSVREHLAPVDSVQSALSVREDTAELANYFLSVKKTGRSPSFLQARSQSSVARQDSPLLPPPDEDEAGASAAISSETIHEESEPPSPDTTHEELAIGGPSMLTTMLRRSPPDERYLAAPKEDQVHEDSVVVDDSDDDYETVSRVTSFEDRPWPAYRDTADDATDASPLITARSRESRHSYGTGNGAGREPDLESQKRRSTERWVAGAGARLAGLFRTVGDPKSWDRPALWRNMVLAPVECLPAVIVGLLLNILDALSYGMILFPLGSPIFASLGSAGISIFYVSTIISQLTFSAGSIFKGGVGSELIEVVPFFHSMAATITDLVGEDKPEAVITTTITSYALSSMLTGTVFFLMGHFKFGYLVGFIPRHILIGCIGGVGWFLVATGFEVTARMDGSFNYDLDTLNRLIQPDTVPLWIIPLTLAVILFYGQMRFTSKFFLPLFIMVIPAIFYFFVVAFDSLNTDALRNNGWIFEGPPAGEPWWYFYTLYKFHLIEWTAIAQCIPAMLALTFFGILHVPINVPALALNTGEDHADLDHELKLHGYSNILSGLAGSIQNYLVYANSLFFMRSGGNTRLAGVELAFFTSIFMVVGPSMIGFIPVMMVGVLIFDLGFELLLEAIWHPRKKLKLLEYLTVVAIVLIMGIYDFVVGIGVGILLAFISLIFQTSRVSAVRATYSGEAVGSTVRRNPTQQHYLRQVGRQINIIKLAGYLFFGTIVSVEDKIRALIAEEEFSRSPIKYLILDLWQVTGLDYSAGEVFNTISRLLDSKGIELVLSGVNAQCSLGSSLRAVGLGEDGIEVKLLPELNSALEYCENELLKTLYANQETIRKLHSAPTSYLDVPGQVQPNQTIDLLGSSPRRAHLHEAARKSLGQMEGKQVTRWQSFKEPLRLMLQIFRDVSDKNEDFWFRSVKYFSHSEYVAGTVLFRRGEPAEGFYLLESGILRAEYDLPQGWLFESIVAGTTCGELPFFSETNRTAKCVAERDCVVWQLDRENWEKMQKEEPAAAQELLRISLKLTSERLSVITSYTLTMAG
ncbi:sulfate transporter family-domain-containing protein [Lasiosphaeria miniovina]|uniref:Sulfate transporter family-domain-containing protein n=1 Tax=Lasiosphaeria miniovina TaxID=1954250 RepID=A0AA40BIJ2_9PEZI|nr:sulfate transporter family-domain-containing protein [Lasiosphaeria miniovina]KAK0734849.1 sulfate transporter family-domain-containing protein [Lasiosphaeria miniovina]